MKQLMNHNIAAVVVTYNRKDLLRQCIQKLLSQKEISLVIIENELKERKVENGLIR